MHFFLWFPWSYKGRGRADFGTMPVKVSSKSEQDEKMSLLSRAVNGAIKLLAQTVLCGPV